jgi:hypothetical protein
MALIYVKKSSISLLKTNEKGTICVALSIIYNLLLVAGVMNWGMETVCVKFIDLEMCQDMNLLH